MSATTWLVIAGAVALACIWQSARLWLVVLVVAVAGLAYTGVVSLNVQVHDQPARADTRTHQADGAGRAGARERTAKRRLQRRERADARRR